ncbi:MAG TPA: 2,3-bisphosphoglycerate-independent phosphoglycerate mutase, partial [Phycisphaerae bacterium]|nr:2,3-bisphosphoglycerate-independent phosphoglycerate mutase [Phycisphaerae bacterium]
MTADTSKIKRPLMIIVRDGWGENPHPEMDAYNAVKLARHPVDDMLMSTYPNALIHTCGEWVGLPEGVMGNSEVGHQNIGAGRIVDQETMRITRRIRDGSFFENSTLRGAFEYAKKHNSRVHILGLCSDGRVHSDQEHAYAILELAKKLHFPGDRVFIHAITDGRDTAPQGGKGYLVALEKKAGQIGIGVIASVVGRYYAMDRDNRWDRVQKAYDLLTLREGKKFPDAQGALADYYAHPTEPSRNGDEFVTPCVIGSMDAAVKDNDAIIFFNYRGDRPREITKAFVYSDEEFKKEKNGGFVRKTRPKNIYFATMTAYEEGLPVNVVFPKPEKMKDIMGMHIASQGLKQFRSAETEKFPHVTFFFNDYREEPFPSEDRKMADSPKVSTYDHKPEMSAEEVTQIILTALDSGTYDFYVLNFANGDMVGHTGNLTAAIKAVETVDACLGRVLEKLKSVGGIALVLADHGNCEQMWDPVNNCPHTSHTTYDVRLIVVDDR